MSPSCTAHPEFETAFQAHNFIFQLDDFGLEPLFILYLFIYFLSNCSACDALFNQYRIRKKRYCSMLEICRFVWIRVSASCSFRSVHQAEGIHHLCIYHLDLLPLCRFLQKPFRKASKWETRISFKNLVCNFTWIFFSFLITFGRR